MAIKKADDGRWTADIQPGGRGGKRFQKTFKFKAEAEAWVAWVKTNTSQKPDWQPKKKDTRTLKNLITAWHDGHGCHLRDSESRKRILEAMAESLNCSTAAGLTSETFTSYRKKRLEEGLKPASLNNELAYLKAVFNWLIKNGQWTSENPLKHVKPIKLQEQELTFLTPDQIKTLLSELKSGRNNDALLITKICLSTGCRWSEAEELKIRQLQTNKIQFARTKSGKARAVPIAKELAQEISDHGHQENGRVFGPAMGAFKHSIGRAEIDLPDGQMTHVLRHTFASHFMQNGGNILTLQRILGHQSLAMTMRYAHLSPEHLADAVRLNPLNKIASGS